jgi:ribokinase
MKPLILVVGSMNMDLVVKTDEIPNIGETVLGTQLLQIPGGKGANQAVAISKLKNNVVFLGKVGNDSFGESILNSMGESAVNIDHIEKVDDSTGIAIINVDKSGNNNIIVIPGANGKVDKEYLNRNKSVFQESKIVLFQLEIPIEAVKEGLNLAKKFEKTTILNPAPAMDLDNEIINNIDILIPNEHELERISKVKIVDTKSMIYAAGVLLDKGIKRIIVTLGSRGVLYIDSNGHEFYNAYDVNVVDTTAAGDSFIGGFTSSYVIDPNNIGKAIEMGQKIAALSIQKVGAQSSLPTLEDVENFKLDGK